MASAEGSGRIEIIFYVIATIVALAVNAYRSYSKKKAGEINRPVEKETDFPDVFFEPVAEQQEPSWGEESYSETEMPSVPEEIREEVQEFVKQDDAIDVVEEDEGVAALSATMDQLNLEDQNEEEITIADYFRDDSIEKDQEISDFKDTELPEEESFNLRKAVIYSEILKPKYINNNY